MKLLINSNFNESCMNTRDRVVLLMPFKFSFIKLKDF